MNQNKLVQSLKDEVKKLRQQAQEQEMDMTFNKAARIQKQLDVVEGDNQQLQAKINKLEAQKSRLESVFKSSMKGGNMELFDEVQMMVRRIEFLEEQSEKRSKVDFLENQEPYLREIEMLKSKLAQEREIRDQMLQKKNAEVSYFKTELDALLGELKNQVSKKQARCVN